MDILNKLTIKHLTMNKKRTIVTIIGVILSTALMVGIGLLFSTVRDNIIVSITNTNGSHHALFNDVSSKQLETIKHNNKIANYFYSEDLGYALLEESYNSYKPYLKVIAGSDSYFDELLLLKGRLPQNSAEVVISEHILTNSGIDLKIGDTLKLEIGTREFSMPTTEEYYQEGEKLIINMTKTYTIVGIVERSIYESYSDPGYSIFTKINNGNNYQVYVTYKNIKNTYDNTDDIAKSLGIIKKEGTSGIEYYENIQFNDPLLGVHGLSKYNNMLNTIAGVLAIILTLISIGCIVVIYNSFAISVMERKKQFGLFSSIGATKKQLRKTVFYEAFIIGIIGIPIGILSSFIGIGIVLMVVNNLLPDIFDTPLRLSVYSTFIIIPLVFMVITILVSAFIPAKRASKITPIEAIRLNDDIKIKKRKLRGGKIIKKLFGIEGELAFKNMKRNKKKYRITVASLFISIVLFVSFSSLLNYLIDGTTSYIDVPSYDITMRYNGSKDIKNIKEILEHPQVKEYSIVKTETIGTNTDLSQMMTKEFKEIAGNVSAMDISLVTLDQQSFDKYLQLIGESEAKPIIFNRYKQIEYSSNARKVSEINRFTNSKIDIDLCNMEYLETDYKYDCYSKIKDYYITDKYILGLEEFMYSGIVIIVPPKDFDKYVTAEADWQIYLRSPKYDVLEKVIEKYMDDDIIEKNSYYNIAEMMQLQKNIVLVISILVYGFISLVTLIGVTSVFNTINTSIALRRKEFSVLRSIGLTPKGFNKILYFESIFVGLKSLLYALPIAICVIYLIHLSMNNMVSFEHLVLPIKSILIAIIGVFIIVILTMMYASSKVKHENILDAIREENI